MKKILNIILSLSMALTIFVMPNIKMIKANDDGSTYVTPRASVLPMSGSKEYTTVPGTGLKLGITVYVVGTKTWDSIDGITDATITSVTASNTTTDGVYASNLKVTGYTKSVGSTSVVVKATIKFDILLESNGNILYSDRTATVTVTCL